MDRIMFLVTHGTHHVLTYSLDREDAKKDAWGYLGYDSDNYIVTPLTSKGDTIRFNFSVFV